MKFPITVCRINRDKSVALRVRRYFNFTPGAPLLYELHDRGLGQADLVLCLLRLGCRRSRDWIAELIGHPITVCPPQKRTYPLLKEEKKQRIRWVVRNNPRQPNTDAHARFVFLRPGRTVEECIMRGATPRDVRSAIRRGWIHVS